MDFIFYLIVGIIYVVYSLLKAARKQREEHNAHQPEQDESWPETIHNIEHITSERPLYEQYVVSPPKPRQSSRSGPFLNSELDNAMASTVAARESFLRKTDGEMPEIASLKKESKNADKPSIQSALSYTENNTYNLNQNSVDTEDITSHESLRRAVITMEILNRKY